MSSPVVLGTQRRIVSDVLNVFVSGMSMLWYKNTVHCAQRWQVCPLWLRNVRFLPIFTSARWWQRFARTLNPLQTGWTPANTALPVNEENVFVVLGLWRCASSTSSCQILSYCISESSHLQAGCMAPAIFHILTSVLVIFHSCLGLPQLSSLASSGGQLLRSVASWHSASWGCGGVGSSGSRKRKKRRFAQITGSLHSKQEAGEDKL